MDVRKRHLAPVALVLAWAGGLAFTGLASSAHSVVQGLGRSTKAARHAVMDPPTRMRPPDVDVDVRSKASEWAECNVQFADRSADAEEVWVFRRKDFEEFQRLIGLRLSYRKPGHAQDGPAQYGEARREEAMAGTKVLCRERTIDASLLCSQCIKVFTGGAYKDAGIAVPAHPEAPEVMQCLAHSVGEVETGANATAPSPQAAMQGAPLKQTAFCNY
ncbi:unnamed protein product, partial [Effrenium voratum]